MFRITKKEETTVRKKLTSAYVTLETRKDGIKFTNAKLRRLSETYTKLTEEYTTAQKDLVAKVVHVAATFAEVSGRKGSGAGPVVTLLPEKGS